MEFSEVVKRRHSIRKYKPESILQKEEIDQMLTAAMDRPRSNDRQPREVCRFF